MQGAACAPDYNVRVKRLLRILRGSATLLSLLLFLLTLILWPRSYYVADGISHSRNGYDEKGSLIRRTRGIQWNSGYCVATAGHFSSLLFDSVGTKVHEGLHPFSEPLLGDDIRQSPFLTWYRFGFGHAKLDAELIFLNAWFMPLWFLELVFSFSRPCGSSDSCASGNAAAPISAPPAAMTCAPRPTAVRNAEHRPHRRNQWLRLRASAPRPAPLTSASTPVAQQSSARGRG
jgi:hypothetical protein